MYAPGDCNCFVRSLLQFHLTLPETAGEKQYRLFRMQREESRSILLQLLFHVLRILHLRVMRGKRLPDLFQQTGILTLQGFSQNVTFF